MKSNENSIFGVYIALFVGFVFSPVFTIILMVTLSFCIVNILGVHEAADLLILFIISSIATILWLLGAYMGNYFWGSPLIGVLSIFWVPCILFHAIMSLR
jgi:hypothetical protein